MRQVPRLKQAVLEAAIRGPEVNFLNFISQYAELILRRQPIPRYPLVLVFLSYLFLLFPSFKYRLHQKEDWKFLPFNIDLNSIKEIKGGSTKLVFKVTLVNGKSYAIKIAKATIGLDMEGIKECVFSDKCSYSEVDVWYESLGVVHPTSYLIANTPFKGAPAVLSIQEWIDSEIIDLFSFVDCPETLVELAKLDLSFKRKLIAFCVQTLFLFDQKKRSIDIFGSENVVVSRSESGQLDLHILDCEALIFYGDTTVSENEMRRALSYMNLLRYCVEELGET